MRREDHTFFPRLAPPHLKNPVEPEESKSSSYMFSLSFFAIRHAVVASLALACLAAGQAHAQVTNDKFATPMSIGAYSFDVTQSNAGAGVEPGEPPHGSLNGLPLRSLWYRIVPPQTGYYSMDVTNSTAPGTRLAVYRGTKLTSLVAVKKTTSTMYVELTKGVPYLIAADADGDGDIKFKGKTYYWMLNASTHEAALPLLDADEGWEPTEYGRLVISVAPGGGFTGKIYLGNGSYSFKGRLQPGGTLVEIPRTGLSTVRLNVQPQSSIFGMFFNLICDYQPDVTQARSKVFPMLTRTTSPRPGFVQRYNFLDVDRFADPRLILDGYGFTVGTVSVSAKGQVLGTLVLPDGVVTTFSSGALRPPVINAGDGILKACFHTRLYAGGGQVTGELTLNRSNLAAPVYSGRTHWVVGKENMRRKFYHTGTLVDNATLTLQPYTPPAAGQRIWHNESPAVDGKLYYTEPLRATFWSFPLALSTANRVTIPPTRAIVSPAIKMTPAIGMAVGSFRVGLAPGPYQSISFRAFYMPDYAEFYGLQSNLDGTTYIEIEPN